MTDEELVSKVVGKGNALVTLDKRMLTKQQVIDILKLQGKVIVVTERLAHESSWNKTLWLLTHFDSVLASCSQLDTGFSAWIKSTGKYEKRSIEDVQGLYRKPLD